jgi:hypothetical protein
MRLRVLLVVTTIALIAAVALPSFASGAARLKARMTGAKVVGAQGSPNGFGKAHLKVNSQKQLVCFRINWSHIGGRGGLNIGIYTGRKGENGNEVIELVGRPQRSPAVGCEVAASNLLQDIKKNAGDYHINVKNTQYNRFGAIRGQLKRTN